jgi:hypothetical protein
MISIVNIILKDNSQRKAARRKDIIKLKYKTLMSLTTPSPIKRRLEEKPP